MKNKEGKNTQDRTRNDHDIGDDVYANMDELNKEADLKRSKEKEKTPKTMKVSTSKTTNPRLILAALIFLFIVFLFLIVITSLLLKNYLAMDEEMSHLKNHENVLLKDGLSELKNRTDNQERKVLEDVKAFKNDLEILKKNFLQDINAISKTLEIVCRTCPPGWKKIGLFCYYLSTDELSWDNAKDQCVAKGSALVFLQTKEETEALKSLIENDRYWIGLKRDTEPGKWKWVDGSMLSHSNWHKDEPNNLPNEDCVESLKGYWNDQMCSFKMKYICKKCCFC